MDRQGKGFWSDIGEVSWAQNGKYDTLRIPTWNRWPKKTGDSTERNQRDPLAKKEGQKEKVTNIDKM